MFLGIDPSLTSTGIVVLDEGEPVLDTTIRFPKLKGMPRLEAIASEINRILVDFPDISQASIETPFAGMSKKVYSQLVEVNLFIRYIVWSRSVPLLLVSPSQLKQFVGAKGTGKTPVADAVLELYGYSHKKHDVVDAYVLSRMSEASKNLDCCLSMDQRKILGKLSYAE